jgi:hypothetical protein
MERQHVQILIVFPDRGPGSFSGEAVVWDWRVDRSSPKEAAEFVLALAVKLGFLKPGNHYRVDVSSKSSPEWTTVLTVQTPQPQMPPEEKEE